MPPRLRGKWALGITPRNFTWIMKDKLAVCERPGGYGDNHRRVRRQEEIIWLRENGFGCVISIIPAPHNLHNYDELGLHYLHRPFTGTDDLGHWLKAFYTELHGMLEASTKVIAHNESVDDRIIGIMGGWIIGVQALGFNFLSEHPGSIEIAGVLLMMAMLGAVVLSRKQVQLDEEAKLAQARDLASRHVLTPSSTREGGGA